jgi:hypothetical protein
MTDRVDTLIDHAAALQREVDQLREEVLLLALAGIALGMALMLMGWKLWHA